MNKQVILLVTLALASVLADPISKQKVSADNNPPLSQTEKPKHDDKPLLNKSDSEQKNEITHTTVETGTHSEDATNIGESNMQIYIEETVDPVGEQFPQIQNELTIDDGAFTLLDREDLDRDELMESNPDEIMQTAAGFVPIPIIRRRQKQNARRRFATRRQFKRHSNPYTAWRYFHPSYSYYPFYRPSSLRYFYY